MEDLGEFLGIMNWSLCNILISIELAVAAWQEESDISLNQEI